MPELKYIDYILDNIHGYIALTDLEKQIEQLPVFRRLRRIKQLGLSNWIFPGAEHTRYSHCLGVMHIADMMALRLDFNNKDRQLIRVCGMLHDIGHYPISHVGERAYISNKNDEPINFLDMSMETIMKDLDTPEPALAQYVLHTYMERNHNDFHHELIGEKVIRSSSDICKILEDHDIDIDDVCAIITGDIQNRRLVKHVQLLHSELDADRIDYLLRDTFSSGTSYGKFEINTLVKNLEIATHKEYEVDIIGVNEKGIASADQFLTNRYFAYSQVFYNKNVIILNYMVEKIMDWMLASKIGALPNCQQLTVWIENQDHSSDFFEFTDDFIIQKIRELSVSNLKGCPEYIKLMVEKLNNYVAPQILEPSFKNNVIISGINNEEIKRDVLDSGFLAYDQSSTTMVKCNKVYLTEHVRKDDFVKSFHFHSKNLAIEGQLDTYLTHRLINGIAFINRFDDEISLLTDMPASLTKDLSRHKTIFLRRYKL